MEKRFSPREFLKARRPERFSDSVDDEGPALDALKLGYHLEHITSQSQEADFQRFAVEIAKREVCPNLLPQTGPTGGGDSKVDAETYPVADGLSLVWHIGIGREACAERWGFAISASKKWLPKLASDIAKIAGTGRGYSKAFYITNQFVSDKRRAAAQDGLRKKYGLEVWIYDRSWILEKVFAGRHEQLAIEHLRLPATLRRVVKQGPLDLERERELEEVEKRINAAIQDNRNGYQVVEDCIEAALLARGLERPRTEVDGHFVRAERVGMAHGTNHQKLKATYNKAWTTYWWYEDYRSFAGLYDSVQELAKNSHNAYDFELLTNLWVCLHAIAMKGEIDEATAKILRRTELLTEELKRLSKEDERPSAALQSRTFLVQIRLQQAFYQGGDPDPMLREYSEIIRKSEGLAGYPLEPLVQIITEMGALVGNRPAYEQLYESLTETTSRRKGETVAARMLLKRGAQQLEAECPYDAIRSLGRALRRLFTHESRQDIVRALYFIGCAYEQVGLLWAARGSLLSAASIAMSEFWTYGDITGLQGSCVDQVKWLELQLGRVPQVLAWHETDRLIKPQLVKEGLDEEKLRKREMEFDSILGMLLLKSSLPQLEHLSNLPESLESLDLLIAGDALRFALGHTVQPPQGFAGEATKSEAVRQFFGLFREQPAYRDLPERPELYTEEAVQLSCALLGCRINVDCENSPQCVALAESILAALESLMATGLVDGMGGREPILTITIQKIDSTAEPFAFEMQERAGRHHVEIRCGLFDPHSLPLDAQQKLKERMEELLASVVARIFWIPDVESVFTRLFRDDRALERSIHFTSTFVNLGNVLGHAPKDRISDWYEPNARKFQVLRSAVWDAEVQTAEAAGGIPLGCDHDRTDRGNPAAKRLDFGRTKHNRMKTVSLIREMLWDRAGWNATLFLSYGDEFEPPAFAPTFREPGAAGEIFAELRKEIGPEDSKEILRIAIIRGIDKRKPQSYRVVIGTNIRPEVNLEQGELLFAVSRVQTMYPDSEENLERFLRDYRRTGAYHFIHAIMRGNSFEAEPVWDNHILKRELIVKHAWEVGRQDPDAVGILEDDDPIIPPDHGNAPVLELLAWKRQPALRSGDMPSCSANDSRASSPSRPSPKEQAAARKANRKRDKKTAKKKKKR